MAGSLSSGISGFFNKAASFIFNKHTLIHLAFMAALMTFPMIMSAVPAGAATLGDLAVQTGHMYGSMLVEGVKALPVGVDLISNTLSGNFAANTMAMGSMGAMHATAAHGTAALTTTGTAINSLWGAGTAELMAMHPPGL
jgi:hypothetical protein